jgi:hypothetical protein
MICISKLTQQLNTGTPVFMQTTMPLNVYMFTLTNLPIPDNSVALCHMKRGILVSGESGEFHTGCHTVLGVSNKAESLMCGLSNFAGMAILTNGFV